MERAALDTSAAVPLLVDGHPSYFSVLTALGDRSALLTGHSLAETYSVLTRLPAGLRVDPADVATAIDDRFGPALVIPDDQAWRVHRVLAAAGVAGGATYDGLVALAARYHGVPLITRDVRARATYSALGVEVVTVS
jgi:predicted nucleic acid-binding protein